jgi:hypothetical protein
MKKFILPALGILSVALFSFKSASSSEGRIVRCEDGTVIVPSSCPITLEDQHRIVSILTAAGPGTGYAVYTSADGATYVHNPTPVEDLRAVDMVYGTDLSSGTAFLGWFYREEKWTKDRFESRTIAGTSMAVRDNIEAVLSHYE